MVKQQKYCIMVNPDDMEKIKDHSVEEMRSVSATVRYAIRKFLEGQIA